MRDMSHEEKQILLQKTAVFYWNKGTEVHIILKKGGWERGFIQEEPSADFFILKYSPEGAKKHGIDNAVLFYIELEDIQERKKKEGKVNGYD